MKFTDQLRQQADECWQRSFTHPFIMELAEGSLPENKFVHYVQNDAYYLGVFAKVQAIGASKAADLKTSGRMAFHAHATANAEHALHETFFGMLGLEKEVNFLPAPTAYQYTTHLISVAHTGTLGEIIAAILPCYWLYWEIGVRYQLSQPNHPIYSTWIETYGNEWFSELVKEQINRLDELARFSSAEERQRMERHFKISSEYEYRFWDMAYNLESWQID